MHRDANSRHNLPLIGKIFCSRMNLRSLTLRIWVLRWLAVCLGLLPFVFAELAIRLIEPSPQDAVDSDPWVNLHQLQPLFVKNSEGDRWEIPSSRTNFFCRDSFSANKQPNTRRIFVLGGSTVQGRPYATETAFSTWLRIKLQVANPNTHFEVINCGGVSYASYRVAKIMEEVIGHQPDAIILYTGHNEFLEDREYSHVREMGPIRSGLVNAARRSRLASWIKERFLDRQADAVHSPAMPQEVLTRLDQIDGLDKYQRDPKWRQAVESHFSKTLERMINQTNRANVPLILCIPASDLLQTPPFKTAMATDLSESESKQFRLFQKRSEDPERSENERLIAARECLKIDPDHAGSHYLCGRILFKQGKEKDAAHHLTQARDHDVCPLRATSHLIASVQKAIDHPQVLLVDVPKQFDCQNSQGLNEPDGVPDPQWFVDHVHPSIKGHQVIANRCYEAIRSLPWANGLSEPGVYESKITEHLSELDESYFARGKQRLKGLRRWTQGRATTPISLTSPQ